MMIRVKDMMTSKVRTIPSTASAADAAKAMARWKIGCLIVSDGRTAVGIITEGDISRLVAKGLDPQKAPVTSSRRRLVTTEPGERIEVAARTMAQAGVKKLPVMDGKELVGIITQTDIVNSSFALVTSLKEMVQARYRPPDFEV
jgi:CBS domain-containing protein